MEETGLWCFSPYALAPHSAVNLGGGSPEQCLTSLQKLTVTLSQETGSFSVTFQILDSYYAFRPGSQN